MTSDEKAQKISIGFHGGQSLAARVKPSELSRLREALGKGEGWHELGAEDGSLYLDLRRVDFVLTDSDEHRVGF
jgi:hypothetical protein